MRQFANFNFPKKPSYLVKLLRQLGTIFLVSLLLVHCDKITEWGKRNARNKLVTPPADEKDLAKWKQKLQMEEAEIRELDLKIRKMVRKTAEAGALSWKIARAYMKVGNYELGSRYYTVAMKEQQSAEKGEVLGAEVHFFETAIEFFDKASLYGKNNEELLFESGLAYANASKDKGWEKNRRTTAVKIFTNLMRINPEDTRYPYQLALLYFDSSQNDNLIDGGESSGYQDQGRAFRLLTSILQKEPKNIPARFARANFLFRQGDRAGAEVEYTTIRQKLEDMKKSGEIREDLNKMDSWKNVNANLEKIRKNKQSK